MTVDQLQGDHLHRATGDRRSAIARRLDDARAAISALYRGLVALIMRPVSRGQTFHGDNGGELSPQDDPARYPQWPLILGDKWDF
jgi:hypothetical protein